MRKWVIGVFVCWLTLTVIAVPTRQRPVDRSGDGGAPSGARVVLNNSLDTLASPALGAVHVLQRYDLLKTAHGTAFVYGIGLMVPLGAVLVLLVVRSRLHQRSRSTRANADPPDLARRRLLIDGAAIGAGLAMASTPVYAAAIEPNTITVRRYRVPIKGLPGSLDGLRIVQISDTHLGPRVHESHIAASVRIALEQRPDIVALTGDYVHDGPAGIDRAAELFEPLTSDPGVIGVVGVLGNHDWYADGPRMRDALRAIGVRMVDNDRVFLSASSRSLASSPPARPDDALCFVGLGDLLTHTVEPARAFSGIDPDTPRVLLAHVPDTLELPGVRAPDGPRIDLALSGHTHGGQIRVPLLGTPGVPSQYGQRYAGGLIDASIAATACPAVVSRGIGVSIVPVRFGVPPEVVVIELSTEI